MESIDLQLFKDSLTTEEKTEILTAKGWHPRKMKIEHPELGVRYFHMWGHKKRKILGVTVDCAILHERWRAENKKRKQELRDYKAQVDCNKCGSSLLKIHHGTPSGYYGLVDGKVMGGYYSDELIDCTEYTFQLCEKCLIELFATFKIPVKTESRLD